MKNEIKQLLRDLRVAAMLGRSEALDIALDGMLALPGIASNDRMNDGFIEQVILPIGKTLTTLKSSELRPLLKHQLAAGRAVGAVALAHLFVDEKNATPKDLRQPAGDSRADVRIALGLALLSIAEKNPEKLLDLGTAWLMQSVPKMRHTALIFIPGLASQYGERIVGLVGPLIHDEDYEVRRALADCLNTLGQGEFGKSVLDLLALWASEPHPNTWVIARVLSSSWVVAYPQEAEAILRTLKSLKDDSSHVSNTLKALKRHGLGLDLE